MPGNCSPIMMKMKPLRRKATISQKDLRLEPEARGERGRMPPDINACRDNRQHAGDSETFGEQISGKRGEERNRDLHRRIIQVALHPADDHPDEQPKRHPAETDQNKTKTGLA